MTQESSGNALGFSSDLNDLGKGKVLFSVVI